MATRGRKNNKKRKAGPSVQLGEENALEYKEGATLFPQTGKRILGKGPSLS